MGPRQILGATIRLRSGTTFGFQTPDPRSPKVKRTSAWGEKPAEE
jgi:hypothetical protein